MTQRQGKRIYLDYAGATPVLPSALRAYARAASMFANPGSIHTEGVAAKSALTEAREAIAHQLACKARQLVFVSGGTEANNLAIVGRARYLERLQALKDTHWIVSAIEHPSVLECFSEVERLGGRVTHVPCNAKGQVTTATLRAALKKETVFVSIGWVNHEIGTTQELSALARVIRAHEREHGTTVFFHSDAGQGALYRSAQVHTFNVDLFTLDSGKMYAPRGLGVVYVSNRAQLAPVLCGGKQERGLRPGTEPLALAAAFAEAYARISEEREVEMKRVKALRDHLARLVLKNIPGSVVNGDLAVAAPNMLNFSIPESVSGCTSEYLALALDRRDIAISTKSACREGEQQISHVVAALSQGEGDKWRAKSALRFSLGRGTKKSDIASAVSALQEVIDQP